MGRSVEIHRSLNGWYSVILFVGDPDTFIAEGERRRFGLVDITRETFILSERDAEAIISSYEEVVGFDPETGEAIWEKRG